MKVLFVAAEASPFVKVGGLGDVMGGLPAALNDSGVDARVVLPLYSSIDVYKRQPLYQSPVSPPVYGGRIDKPPSILSRSHGAPFPM